MFHTTLHSAPSSGRSPSEYFYPIWYGKTSIVALPDGTKTSRICVTVYTQYRRVSDRRTDRQRDRQTSCHGIVHAMNKRRVVISKWLSLCCPTVDVMCFFNPCKAKKLRSADADVSGMTSHNFTKRTTSVSRRLTPPFEFTQFSAYAISVTVKIEDLRWLLSYNRCKYELRLGLLRE